MIWALLGRRGNGSGKTPPLPSPPAAAPATGGGGGTATVLGIVGGERWQRRGYARWIAISTTAKTFCSVESKDDQRRIFPDTNSCVSVYERKHGPIFDFSRRD